jgi:hypothetical protein
MGDSHSEGFDKLEVFAGQILDALEITNPLEQIYAQKLVDWRATFGNKNPSQSVLRSFQTVVNRRLMQAQSRHNPMEPVTIKRLEEWREWLSTRIEK